MTLHTHTSYVKGCYRCEIGRDEIEASRPDALTVIAEALSDGVSVGRDPGFPEDDIYIRDAKCIVQELWDHGFYIIEPDRGA